MALEVWRRGALVLLFAAAAAAVVDKHVSLVEVADSNMNGEYVLSEMAGTDPSEHHKFLNYAERSADTQYFDVYSPLISSLYSQVFWKTLADVPVPDNIRQRYHNSTMALVGFEVNQVRKTADGDVAVPINVAYNHHFECTLLGKSAQMQRLPLSDQRVIDHFSGMDGHGHPNLNHAWVPVHTGDESTTPSSAGIGAANGGEYRKSYHGWSPGFAHALYAPDRVSITPMQIDTWHRDNMSVTGGPFVPGPVPRNSLAPTSGRDAIYSGLLECPVSTRLQKIVPSTFSTTIKKDACRYPIKTATDCFRAVQNVGLPKAANFTTATVHSTTLPSGCSVSRSGPTTYHVTFNTGSGGTCRANPTVTAATQTDGPVQINMQLDAATSTATLTLTGPAEKWFGVALNASKMGDGPWSLIVSGHGNISEHILADQGKVPTTTPLTPSNVHLVSSSVTGSKRTVVVTRPLAIPGHNIGTLNHMASTLPFLAAVGTGADFAYHKSHVVESMTLLPASSDASPESSAQPACICDSKPLPFGQARGSLQYEGKDSVSWGNNCPPQPRGDLLAQKNPTCDIRTYTGGQIACHHMWSLLDADQDIPWQDKPLEYHLKFRFWYQDWDPARHQDFYRRTWGMASPVEYDVPQCAPGTPTEKCIHTITALFKVNEPSNTHLMAFHPHCHAPTCLSVKLYDNATKELLCEVHPIYGGDKRLGPGPHNEPGFIAVPPCLWGSEDDGLLAPPRVGGRTLYAVKTANSTYGHHGEMAWLQVHLVQMDSDSNQRDCDDGFTLFGRHYSLRTIVAAGMCVVVAAALTCIWHRCIRTVVRQPTTVATIVAQPPPTTVFATTGHAHTANSPTMMPSLPARATIVTARPVAATKSAA